MMRVLCMLAVGVALSGCGDSKAEAPQSAGGATPPVQTSLGLSAEFQQAATEARRYIAEDLRLPANTATAAALEPAAAEASARVKAARDKAVTPADKDVALLLTLLLVKDKERFTHTAMSNEGAVPYERVQATVAELYEARERCDQELRGWLSGTGAREPLESGPCLAEARLAGDTLGVR
jgi:hypothetical protein